LSLRSTAPMALWAIGAATAATSLTTIAAASPAMNHEPRADEEDPDAAPSPAQFHEEAPGVEAPRMRNIEPRTRLYIDATYAESDDLSALPTIAGSARGARLAIGGSLKLSRFQLDLELPAGQVTRLYLIDANPAFMIDPNDKRQTSVALGDSRLGAQWTASLPAAGGLETMAGIGLGVRVPTHTGRFTFHFVDGSDGVYVLPYYFHVQPALLFGGYLGPVSFVMNQGALVLLGPDGEVAGLPVVTPTIYFWDAHYALAARLGSVLLLTFAVNTTLQLNRIDEVQFPHLNRVRSVFLIPGAAMRLGAYRVDLVGRLGVTTGADAVGVITYAGTTSVTLRLTRELD
jgi:hypothetical protein